MLDLPPECRLSNARRVIRYSATKRELGQFTTLLILADYSNVYGICHDTDIPTLAEEAHISPRAFSARLRQLEKIGELFIKTGKGRTKKSMYLITAGLTPQTILGILVEFFDYTPEEAQAIIEAKTKHEAFPNFSTSIKHEASDAQAASVPSRTAEIKHEAQNSASEDPGRSVLRSNTNTDLVSNKGSEDPLLRKHEASTEIEPGKVYAVNPGKKTIILKGHSSYQEFNAYIAQFQNAGYIARTGSDLLNKPEYRGYVRVPVKDGEVLPGKRAKRDLVYDAFAKSAFKMLPGANISKETGKRIGILASAFREYMQPFNQTDEVLAARIERCYVDWKRLNPKMSNPLSWQSFMPWWNQWVQCHEGKAFNSDVQVILDGVTADGKTIADVIREQQNRPASTTPPDYRSERIKAMKSTPEETHAFVQNLLAEQRKLDALQEAAKQKQKA